MSVLSTVRKHFPQVEEVVDATKPIRLEVTKRDVNAGRKKDPNTCALARACVRQLHADGAIINIAFSYVITGKVATRYKTSHGVGREITSFDRHGDFAEGNDYLLSPISPSARLGIKAHGNTSGPHKREKKHHRILHRTSNIRIHNV